ncbi:hypothetical protein RB195_015606 [Necator americanus]|uniref:Uncharacterized protein n=1 Tax=Necator americanus TaxID=51031 RepID=A0ABR1E810_NECAM
MVSSDAQGLIDSKNQLTTSLSLMGTITKTCGSCVVYLKQYRGLARREEEFDGICMVSETSNHFQAFEKDELVETSGQ